MVRTFILAIALAGLPAIAPASIGQHWGAGVSTGQARGIALGQIPGGTIASGARLRAADGRIVYRFGVRTHASVETVEVDAMTGAPVRPSR